MDSYEELRRAVQTYLDAKDAMGLVRPGYNLQLRGAVRDNVHRKLLRELLAAERQLRALVPATETASKSTDARLVKEARAFLVRKDRKVRGR